MSPPREDRPASAKDTHQLVPVLQADLKDLAVVHVRNQQQILVARGEYSGHVGALD